MRCWCMEAGLPSAPDQVWLLKRASEVEGTDFRDAQPSTGPEWPAEHHVHADDGGGRPLLQVHVGALGIERDAGVDGDCAGQQGARGGGDQSAIRDQRRD